MSNKAIMNGVNVLFEKLEKQEKLLELYKELINYYDDLLNNIDLTLLGVNNYYKIKIIKLKQQIEELEND